MPTNPLYRVWRVCVSLVTVLLVTFLPIMLCYHDEEDHFGLVMTLRCVFLVDTVLKFFVAYTDQRHFLVQIRSRIIQHHLRSWFTFDLLLVLPIELILFGDPNMSSLRLRNLFSMSLTLHAIKNATIPQLIVQISMRLRLSPAAQKLFHFLTTLGLLTHNVTCLFHVMAKFERNPDALEEANSEYIKSFYWAFQTATTVGFGNISLRTTSERLFGMIWMCIGVALTMYLAGNIQMQASEMARLNDNLKEKQGLLHQFAADVGLTVELERQIARYLELSSDEMRNFALLKSQQDIEEIPLMLRAQLVYYLFSRYITSIPIFINHDIALLTKMAIRLRAHTLEQGELLYSHGDYTEDIFFLLRGSILLISETGDVMTKYTRYDILGVPEVLNRKKYRKGSAKATERCFLFSLDARTLNNIARDHPEIMDELRRGYVSQSKKPRPRLTPKAKGRFYIPPMFLTGTIKDRLFAITEKCWKGSYMAELNFRGRYVQKAIRRKLEETNHFKLLWRMKRVQRVLRRRPVSYTHLTLPTIYSV
eukprot:TRINITY_DN4353_c0_g2_i2.p1 TRINITY_DN4353_c0_g2~~TRINITY_DN4353_c0_g2_i2.p1  ORF type:complete len:535 (-),score=83.45 TRINITY_DN4353_c0_g2_i2:37-1641(-)